MHMWSLPDQPCCMLHTSRRQNCKNRFAFFQMQRTISVIFLFSIGTAVYTGPGPVMDVFSTTNRMTVLFITDKLLAKGGFKANFTTGYYLGIPGMCTWDYMLHCNFQSKTIKACSVSKPKCDFSVCIWIYSFSVITSEIFFPPLHLRNHCLGQFKAGMHIIFSRFTCSSMRHQVVNFAHLRGPF